MAVQSKPATQAHSTRLACLEVQRQSIDSAADLLAALSKNKPSACKSDRWTQIKFQFEDKTIALFGAFKHKACVHACAIAFTS